MENFAHGLGAMLGVAAQQISLAWLLIWLDLYSTHPASDDDHSSIDGISPMAHIYAAVIAISLAFVLGVFIPMHYGKPSDDLFRQAQLAFVTWMAIFGCIQFLLWIACQVLKGRRGTGPPPPPPSASPEPPLVPTRPPTAPEDSMVQVEAEIPTVRVERSARCGNG